MGEYEDLRQAYFPEERFTYHVELDWLRHEEYLEIFEFFMESLPAEGWEIIDSSPPGEWSAYSTIEATKDDLEARIVIDEWSQGPITAGAQIAITVK